MKVGSHMWSSHTHCQRYDPLHLYVRIVRIHEYNKRERSSKEVGTSQRKKRCSQKSKIPMIQNLLPHVLGPIISF